MHAGRKAALRLVAVVTAALGLTADVNPPA
ncbi:MAG: hypothetical protein JWQ95_49 [Sphaerisporangium sp.]|nr:hypothetical protein [Sphaerisporangium sp.]